MPCKPKNMKYKLLLLLFLFFSSLCQAQEICTNGIDDDADGKIDLNDSDCICNTVPIESIIPNPSFEDHSSCPSNFSELNLATPWIQATTATTDYYNSCGYIAPCIKSMNLENFPNGNGITAALFIKDWNEYLGASLLSPMIAGTNYQLTLNIASVMTQSDGTLSKNKDVSSLEPVKVTIYGCTSKTNLPLNTVFSPDRYDSTWIEIGNATYVPKSAWGEITFSFSPKITVNAIMIGSPPLLPFSYPEGAQSNSYPYFLFDNLLLNTAESFGVSINQAGTFCEDNLVLNAVVSTEVSADATYQWYHNGIAIIDATDKNYKIASNSANLGEYSVKIIDKSKCILSTKATINNTISGPEFTVIQPSCIINSGQITITTPAFEYSFDNGVSWQSEATSKPLAIGTYYVKIKTTNGCISSSVGVNIFEPQLLAGSNTTVIQPKTCEETGSITINSTNAASYSFDDGVTWVNESTATDLSPGMYFIKIKDKDGCQSGAQQISINEVYLDYAEVTTNLPSKCSGGSITITTPASEYSFDGGITWQVSNTLDNLESGTYVIKIKNEKGCSSPEGYVYLYDLEDSYPAYKISNAGCGTYASLTITTPGDSYSFDDGKTWTSDPILTNILGDSNYAIKVRKGGDCISLAKSVYIYSKYLPLPEPKDFNTRLCDNLNDGSENINLTLYNDTIIGNSSAFTFKYFKTRLDAENGNSSGQIQNTTAYNMSNSNDEVYVRVISKDNCFKVAQLKFSFVDSPRITMENTYPLCQFKYVLIDAKEGFSSYSWSNGKTTQVISIRKPGDYWVTVTEDNAGLICPSTKNFNVFLSNPAKVESITTSDWTNSDNIIKIVVSGLGIYEYSIDGINYQDDNAFYNLENGAYQVYIRDKYNCGVVKDEAYLLMYPKFFTPNGDGSNDTWKIKFSENEPGIKIEIFDRYGKLIKGLLKNNLEWDGKFNGKELPSTDYWFVVTRANGKEHRGHFTLKR